MAESITYFQAPDRWHLEKAKEHAASCGLATIFEYGKLFIEERYIPAKFAIEDIYGPYSGYNRLMNDWNGWSIPFFTKEMAQVVMDDYNNSTSEENGYLLKWSGENIVYSEPDADDDIIEPQMITVDGKQLHVYNLGIGWIWTTATVAHVKEKLITHFRRAEPTNYLLEQLSTIMKRGDLVEMDKAISELQQQYSNPNGHSTLSRMIGNDIMRLLSELQG